MQIKCNMGCIEAESRAGPLMRMMRMVNREE
jgi:hypothetical protein